jgi:hypothetical protein
MAKPTPIEGLRSGQRRVASAALVGGFLLSTRNKRQFARLRKGLRLSPSSGRRMVEAPARVLAEGRGLFAS